MPTMRASAAAGAKSPLSPFTIERREPRASEVLVDIDQVNDACEWMPKGDARQRFLVDCASPGRNENADGTKVPSASTSSSSTRMRG